MKVWCYSLLVGGIFSTLAGGHGVDGEHLHLQMTGESSGEVEWDSVTGRTYFLQFGTDMEKWEFAPLIGEGDGGILDFSFESDAPEFFARLRWTDAATADAFMEDFDGDGITSWDEVRVGGTGSDPLLFSTAGDGVSDFYADTDGNLLADGWELEFRGDVGVTDAFGDEDGDGTLNIDEARMGTSPNLADTDGDGLDDGEDADGLDAAVRWMRVEKEQYALVELPDVFGEDADDVGAELIMDLGEDGRVLASLVRVDEGIGNAGADGVPGKGYFQTRIWDVATRTWSADLTMPDNVRGVGARFDGSGNVLGGGWGALDGSAPGIKPVPLRWVVSGSGYGEAVVDRANADLAANFESDGLAWTYEGFVGSVGGSEPYALGSCFGANGRYVLGWDYTSSTTETSLIYLRRGPGQTAEEELGSLDAADGPQFIGKISFAGHVSGWGAYSVLTGANSYVQVVERVGSQGMTTISGLGAGGKVVSVAGIDEDLVPDLREVVAWTGTQSTYVGRYAADGNSVVWVASSRPSGDPNRLRGKVNGRGEALVDNGSGLWRNGQVETVEDAIGAGEEYSGLKALELNDAGMILVKGEVEDENGAIEEKVLLAVPVKFSKAEANEGFDDFERLYPEHRHERPWFMVPEAGSNSLTMEYEPAEAKLNIGSQFFLQGKNVDSDPPISVNSPQDLVLSENGITPLDVEIGSSEGTLQVEGSDSLNLVIYPNRTLTLAVHVINLLNDDVDREYIVGNNVTKKIDVGEGEPNTLCITKGDGNAFPYTTTTGGDDVADFGGIFTGSNGINETDADARDKVLIPKGQGKKNAVIVNPGPDGVLNTAANYTGSRTTIGDDEVVGETITTGEDGLRNTPLVVARRDAMNVPTAAELEVYLNEVFGKQANIWWNVVSLEEHDISFDVGDPNSEYPVFTKMKEPNGFYDYMGLGEEPSPEEKIVQAQAYDENANFNLYFLGTGIAGFDALYGEDSFSKPRGYAASTRKTPVISAADSIYPELVLSKNMMMYAAAHELAHNELFELETALHHPREFIAGIETFLNSSETFPLKAVGDDKERLMWAGYNKGQDAHLKVLLLKEETDRLNGIRRKIEVKR